MTLSLVGVKIDASEARRDLEQLKASMQAALEASRVLGSASRVLARDLDLTRQQAQAAATGVTGFTRSTENYAKTILGSVGATQQQTAALKAEQQSLQANSAELLNNEKRIKELQASLSPLANEEKQLAIEQRNAAAAAKEQATAQQTLTGGLTSLAAAMGISALSIAYGAKQLLDLSEASTKATAVLSTVVDNATELKDRIYALNSAQGNLYDTTTSLNAAYEIASAGFAKSADVLAILASAQNLAKGGLSTVEEAANLVAGALNSYGESTVKAAQYTGIFAKAIQDGKLKASELAGSLGNILPIASQANVRLEEVSSAVTVLAKNFIPANESTQALRQYLLYLLAPGAEAKKTLADLGIANIGTTLTTKGLAASFDDLGKATNSNFDILRKIIPEAKTLGEVMILIKDRGAAMRAETDLIGKSLGLDGEQAQKATTAFERLGNASKDAGTIISESFKGPVDAAANSLARMIQGISDITKGQEIYNRLVKEGKTPYRYMSANDNETLSRLSRVTDPFDFPIDLPGKGNAQGKAAIDAVKNLTGFQRTVAEYNSLGESLSNKGNYKTREALIADQQRYDALGKIVNVQKELISGENAHKKALEATQSAAKKAADEYKRHQQAIADTIGQLKAERNMIGLSAAQQQIYTLTHEKDGSSRKTMTEAQRLTIKQTVEEIDKLQALESLKQQFKDNDFARSLIGLDPAEAQKLQIYYDQVTRVLSLNPQIENQDRARLQTMKLNASVLQDIVDLKVRQASIDVTSARLNPLENPFVPGPDLFLSPAQVEENKRLEERNRILQETKSIAGEIGAGFRGITKDLLNSSKSWTDIVGNTLNSITNAFFSAIDRIIEKSVSSGFESFLGGLFGVASDSFSFGGLPGSFSGGFLGDQLANSINSQPITGLFPTNSGFDLSSATFSGATSSPFPRFADGGVATGPSIFGEAGPEAAVPLKNGKIPVELRNSSNVASGGITVQVYQTINVQALDQAGVEQVLKRNGNVVAGIVLDKMQNSDRYAKAVRGQTRVA